MKIYDTDKCFDSTDLFTLQAFINFTLSCATNDCGNLLLQVYVKAKSGQKVRTKRARKAWSESEAVEDFTPLSFTKPLLIFTILVV